MQTHSFHGMFSPKQWSLELCRLPTRPKTLQCGDLMTKACISLLQHQCTKSKSNCKILQTCICFQSEAVIVAQIIWKWSSQSHLLAMLEHHHNPVIWGLSDQVRRKCVPCTCGAELRLSLSWREAVDGLSEDPSCTAHWNGFVMLKICRGVRIVCLQLVYDLLMVKFSRKHKVACCELCMPPLMSSRPVSAMGMFTANITVLGPWLFSLLFLSQLAECLGHRMHPSVTWYESGCFLSESIFFKGRCVRCLGSLLNQAN